MRLQYLRVYWQREWYAYQVDLAKSQKESDGKIFDSMESFDQDFVDRMLLLFVDRVVLVHSLVFMQCRRRVIKTRAQMRELQGMFDER